MNLFEVIFYQFTIGVIATVSGLPVQVSSDPDQVSGIVSSSAKLKRALLEPDIKHREDAKLEEEGLGSSVISIYDNKQNQYSDLLNPRPIVDTIREQDKYGNTGDGFYPFGRALVNGYEVFANFMNKVLDAPGSVIKNLSQGVTKQLDIIGGRLVGLA